MLMNDNLIEMLFCLFMFSEALYLWYVRRQLDDVLDELYDLLKEHINHDNAD